MRGQIQKKAFNPQLNPYVGKMDEHRDVIFTQPADENDAVNAFLESSPFLTVDLGCGAGNFLRDYALKNPGINCLGFELRFKRLVKGAIKLKKHAINNVRLIQARAEEIEEWIPEDSVNEAYINFPDPWPKKKQRKHRMMSHGFLEKLGKLLKKDGFFVFKTDHKDYYDWVETLIFANSRFHITESTEDLHRSEFNETNIYTEFESLFKGKGYPVYYLKARPS